MNIINNFVRFSAQGNLPAATVVVGDVAACNSRINIVDTVLFPTLVRHMMLAATQLQTLLDPLQSSLNFASVALREPQTLKMRACTDNGCMLAYLIQLLMYQFSIRWHTTCELLWLCRQLARCRRAPPFRRR